MALYDPFKCKYFVTNVFTVICHIKAPLLNNCFYFFIVLTPDFLTVVHGVV